MARNGMEANHTRGREPDKTPTAGHLIRLQRAVPRRSLGERAEFGEHAHQQLFATLHVELAVDAPQVGVHRVRRRPETLGRAPRESPSNTARTMPHSRGERPRQLARERHSPGTKTAWPGVMGVQYGFRL